MAAHLDQPVEGVMLDGQSMHDGPTHLVIVGLMGSGKTTIGMALARRLGLPHRDSDVDLLARTGRSARAIAAAEGVEALHELELQHLFDALRVPEPSVISAAASLVDAVTAREALTTSVAYVVWLRIDPATATVRSRRSRHRPGHESLTAQAARRDPLFASIADLVEDGTDDPGAIVERVAARWQAARTARRDASG
jgi:shikimate kinase